MARETPVTDAYAEARIHDKIAPFPAKPRQALARIAQDLKAAGATPSTRLHYLSAIADLGKLARTTLPQRIQRAAPPRREPEGFPLGPNQMSYKD
jgi:hypothetical protein